MSYYWHKDSTKNSMMHQHHKASAKLGINRRFFLTGLIVLIVTGLILAFVWFFNRSLTTVHRTEAETKTEKLDAPEQSNKKREKIRSRSKQKTRALSKKGDNKGSDGLDDYYKVTLRHQSGGSLEPELGPLAFLNAPRETPVKGGASEGSPLAKSQRLTSQTVAKDSHTVAKDSHRVGELSNVHQFGSTTAAFGRKISREEARVRVERMLRQWGLSP